jgi:hypothetical protein
MLALPLALPSIIIAITGPGALPCLILLSQILTGIAKGPSSLHLGLCQSSELCTELADLLRDPNATFTRKIPRIYPETARSVSGLLAVGNVYSCTLDIANGMCVHKGGTPMSTNMRVLALAVVTCAVFSTSAYAIDAKVMAGAVMIDFEKRFAVNNSKNSQTDYLERLADMREGDRHHIS